MIIENNSTWIWTCKPILKIYLSTYIFCWFSIFMHTHIDIHTHKHVYIYIHMYIYIYIYINVYICVYIHIHISNIHTYHTGENFHPLATNPGKLIPWYKWNYDTITQNHENNVHYNKVLQYLHSFSDFKWSYHGFNRISVSNPTLIRPNHYVQKNINNLYTYI
jgi:hypothetical protein